MLTAPHSSRAGMTVPLVSTSTRSPAAARAHARPVTARCWPSGSPPVITASPAPVPTAHAHASSTSARLLSCSRENRDQSQVCGSSHQEQPTPQPDRRMKAARWPAEGPSPWNDANISATRSTLTGYLAGIRPR